MRSGLLTAAAAAVAALACAAPPALAEPPKIGPPVAELTALVRDGTALLNAHLSPGLDQEVDIGWQTNAGPGDTSPATTNAVTRTITSNLTGKTRVEHVCQIAVDEPIFDADTAADSSWAREIITHELFHCYENQIEGDAANAITGSQAFLQEGMARWVDVDLFSSDPIGISVGSIEKYFASSTVPLLARSYDAVGFWGHLQDVEGDLWSRIPSILRAAAGGRQATVDAALSGVDEEKFFDTWGSSVVNRPEGGSAWTARSPDPTAGFAATIHTITPAGPDSPVSTSLEPYSTNQLMISMPAAPPGDIETVHIDLGDAYARFGVVDNYTGPELKTLTFCGGPSGCSATPTPPAGGCGGGETFVPPPPLTTLPSDALLGIAAGKTSATVTIEYTAISTETATTGTCETPPQPGSDTGTAASGGDPHLIDFSGNLFNFQAAGEFTLLKSTKDNLEIQVRQQPFPHSRTVAVNTAVAMRVGRSVVEIDSASELGVSALVDHHRLRATHAALPGGGSVALVHVGFPLPPGTTVASLCSKFSKFVPGGGAVTAFCEKFIGSLVKGSTTATVRWPDGTTVSVTNSLTGTSETHWAPSLGLQIKVARKRLRHLTGLIGNADVPSKQEFHGRNGTSYNATDILDGDVGTAAQAKILYDEFGASWRIAQHESLFSYARGKSTRSYTIKGFPDEGFNPSTAPPSKKQQAGALCQAAGAKAAAVLHDCEYDVLATGDPAFAGGSGPLQKVAKTYPATSTTTTPTPPVLHPIDLGAGEDAPEVAYDPSSGDTYVAWVDNSGSSIDVCTVTPAAPSCNGGAGPDQLVDPLSAGVGEFFNTQVVVQPGGDVVVLGELLGGSSAATTPGYGGGIVAWVSPAGGAAFGAAGQGVADGGKLLANVEGAGDAPSAGGLALDATDIGVYGDHAPFGNGFTDFALTTPAPSTTPTVDSTGEFGDQLGIDGNQVASIPDPAAPGEYIVVAVGGDGDQPAGCPAGTQGATGYGVGIGTPATLATQAAWSSQYFTPESCQAEAPVLAGGGPDGGSIGLLEDEGPGLFGSGSDGIFYHQFDPATDTFGPALAVSDETSQTLDGPDGLDVSSDGSGGVYASWTDGRGDELDYSSDGGASWPPTPATVNLPTGAGDVIAAGAGQGNAELAYTLNPGSGPQEYVVLVGYSQFAGG